MEAVTGVTQPWSCGTEHRGHSRRQLLQYSPKDEHIMLTESSVFEVKLLMSRICTSTLVMPTSARLAGFISAICIPQWIITLVQREILENLDNRLQAESSFSFGWIL